MYAVSYLLLRALSRYREFAATGVRRSSPAIPSALMSALVRISGQMDNVPRQDLRAAEGMSAFFIVPARTKQSLMNIFSDHPLLDAAPGPTCASSRPSSRGPA